MVGRGAGEVEGDDDGVEGAFPTFFSTRGEAGAQLRNVGIKRAARHQHPPNWTLAFAGVERKEVGGLQQRRGKAASSVGA